MKNTRYDANRRRSIVVMAAALLGILALPAGASSAEKGATGEQVLHGMYRGGLLYCDEGYYRNKAGDDCYRLPEVDGGRWKNGALYCNNGYVKMVEKKQGEEASPGDMSCHKLPEIANAVYSGYRPYCTGGHVMVEGPKCVPQSSVHDPSEILTTVALEKDLCPEGYREAAGACYFTGLKAKSVEAGEMEVQGIRLGMGERQAKAALEAEGYREVSYGFIKTEANGTKKSIEYKLGVPDSREDKYRRLIRISYKQVYPKSLRFDVAEVEAKMKERFGEPDEQRKSSPKEFSIAYKDGGRSSDLEPVFSINARNDFRGQFLVMSLQDPGLAQRLLDEHRAQAEAKAKKTEMAKPAASIDF